MADQADITANHDFTEEALRRHQTTTKQAQYRGRCLFCNEKILNTELYCDEDCRDDYEFEQCVKNKTGR